MTVAVGCIGGASVDDCAEVLQGSRLGLPSSGVQGDVRGCSRAPVVTRARLFTGHAQPLRRRRAHGGALVEDEGS